MGESASWPFVERPMFTRKGENRTWPLLSRHSTHDSNQGTLLPQQALIQNKASFQSGCESQLGFEGFTNPGSSQDRGPGTGNCPRDGRSPSAFPEETGDTVTEETALSAPGQES